MASSTSIVGMQNPSIVLYGAKNARLEDKPVPELSDPHQVIVRINYVGVCGSDVHFWHHGGIGKMVNPNTGIVMGHEASGTIHSIGSFHPLSSQTNSIPSPFPIPLPQSTNTPAPCPGPSVTRVSPGDRVALEPCLPCRFCTFCKSGSYNLCRSMRFAAAPGPPDTPGCLSKFYAIAEDFVYPIPSHMGLDEAVLVEPLAVGVHAVKMGDVRAGETVVVMGSGTIGMMCAAVVREFGALRIIVVDVVQAKLDFAQQWLGVETYLASTSKSGEETAAELLAAFGLDEEGTDTTGGNVDTVIEASGAAASIEAGIHLLRPGGKFVQTGLGRPRIEFPIVAMSQKELMVRGCFRYGPGDYELAVKYLDKKRIDVKSLISSVSKFEDATQAWDKTARGEGVKNLIQGVQD